MEPPESARKWQAKLDQAFPHGVLLTADDESDGRTASFSVPRPEVVDMHGLNPVVFIDIPDHHRNFSGVITGWDPLQDDPCTVVRVTMDMGGEHQRDEVSRWSGNVSGGSARAMREHRTLSLAASERHEVYQGAAWRGEE